MRLFVWRYGREGVVHVLFFGCVRVFGVGALAVFGWMQIFGMVGIWLVMRGVRRGRGRYIFCLGLCVEREEAI